MKKVGSLRPNAGPILKTEILTNSITTTVGDAVILTSGFVALGTTGTLLFGLVDALVDNNGTGLLTTGIAGAAIGSFTNTYLTSSTNQTVEMVRAQVDCSKEALYSVTPDATIGTTTGSDLIGYHTDIADEDETDENTATTATAQMFIWGVDPENSSNQVVSIYESVVSGV